MHAIAVTAGHVIDGQLLAIHRQAEIVLAAIVLQQHLAQLVGIRICQALMQTGQGNRGAVQSHLASLATKGNIQLLDVFNFGQVFQPQRKTTKTTACPCFERHGGSRHQTREFSYPLTPLDQAVLAGGSFTAPRAAIRGNEQVMPAQLFLGHTTAVIGDHDGLVAHRLRQ